VRINEAELASADKEVWHVFLNGPFFKYYLWNYKEAIYDLIEAYDKDSQSIICIKILEGLCYSALDQGGGAIGSYDEAIKTLSEVPKERAIIRMTEALLQRGLWKLKQSSPIESAVTDFSKIIELNPEYARAYYERGLCYSELRVKNREIEDYTRAIELNFRTQEVFMNRGKAYMSLARDEKDEKEQISRYQQAINDYTTALEFDPHSHMLFNQRGLCRKATGEYAEAVIDFHKAIDLNPKEASYYSERGECLLALGQLEAAHNDFDEALKLDKNHKRATEGVKSVKNREAEIKDLSGQIPHFERVKE